MAHTILVVDDNVDELEIMMRVLANSQCDMRVTSATRGETALEILRRGDIAPALILLDLKLPGMSGVDMLREIRSDARLKNIPVVICTNSALESDRREALEAGADIFLHKSFDINQFRTDIRGILECCLR